MDLDLFAGAGGASLGLASLGLDAVGFDSNLVASRTHRAAGHRTVIADLAVYPWAHVRGRVRLLHASPPCQPFSEAGAGEGGDDPRDGMPWVLRAVEEIGPDLVTVENVQGLTARRHRRYLGAFITRLAVLDYRVEYRVLNAADYGVPQTRRRLIVIARRTGVIRWPRRTHTEGGTHGLPRWRSMADAIGWGATSRPFLTVAGCSPTGGFDAQGLGGSEARRSLRAERDSGRWVLNTGRDWKAGGDRSTAQTIALDDPAPAVSGVPAQWIYERPEARDDMIRVPLEDLAALQGFPPDYPFHGNRTEIARQIGNALPPALLAAVLRVNL